MTKATAGKIKHFMGSQASKWTMFKTAIATVNIGAVRAGDCVGITHRDIIDGSHWFIVTATERGPIEPVVMADYQLDSFVL